MVIKTKPDIRAAMDTAFADNTTGAITAAVLRTQLADFADSAAFPGDIDAAILAIPPAAPGASAYETAVAAGYPGTEAEFAQSLLPLPAATKAGVLAATDTAQKTISESTLNASINAIMLSDFTVERINGALNIVFPGTGTRTFGYAVPGGSFLVVTGTSPISINGLTNGVAYQIVPYSAAQIAIPTAGITVTLNPDGTISVTATGTIVPFSVSSPAEYAGAYRVTVANLPTIAKFDGGANDGLEKVFPITGISRQGATLSVKDPLWVFDDAAGAATITRKWKAAGADITGATGLTYVVDYKDVNFASVDVAITVEHKLVQGATTRTRVSTPFTLVKPMVERIERFKSDEVLSNAPTAAFHLYGFQKVLIAYGPVLFPTSLTVGGVAATQIAQTGGLSGARLTLYEYTISTPADAALIANLASNTNVNAFGVWGINGVIKSSVVGIAPGAPTLGSTPLSRTPTNATNAIIALSIGRNDADITVDGAESQEVVDFPAITAYAGIIRNAPLSAQTVTWNTTDRAGLALVLVEPV